MKVKSIIILSFGFLLIISRTASAQFSKQELKDLDSLNAVVNNVKSHDTSVAKAYLNLSEMLYTSNLDTMIPLCLKSQEIINKALKKNPSKKVKKALLGTKSGTINNIAYIYMSKGKVDTALVYLLKSLKIEEELGNKVAIATALNNVGYVYNNLGKVEMAIDYYHLSLKLEEEMGNKEGVATSLNNVGFLYKNQNDVTKALEYFQKSLKLFKELKVNKRIAGGLTNVGSIYELKGDLNKALKYYNEGLEIRNKIEDKEGIAASLNNIGSIYFKQGQIDKSIEFLEKSLKIREEIEDADGIASVLVALSEVYLAKNNISIAKSYGIKGLQLSQELGYPQNIQKAAKILSAVYEKENNGLKALEMYKLFELMKDSISNDETLKAANKQQAKYEFEMQKSIDDAENDKKIALEIEAKKKQKIISTAAILVVVLVVIFLILLWKRLKITKQQKIIIEEAHENLNQYNEEILAQRDLIEEQKFKVEEAYEELNQTNEEILAQRDEIERQKVVLEHKNTDILASISYAKRIQLAILPSDENFNKHLPDAFVFYNPKDIVSGDFYWMEAIGDKVFWAAVDCTGHGVPGAFMSIVGANGLKKIVIDNKVSKPSDILEKLTEYVIGSVADSKDGREIMDGMDIALCCWDKSTNKVEYAGAYNPLYLLRNNEIEIIKATKRPIGRYLSKVIKPFENHEFKVEKGDVLYVFTDGYADQFGGEKGGKYSYLSFREQLLANSTLSMLEQRNELEKSFHNWKGNEKQLDDVCIIGVRI